MTGCDAEFLHFRVANLDALLVCFFIEQGFDFKPMFCLRGANAFQGNMKHSQGPSLPVVGDEAEKEVFDRLPFGNLLSE